MFFELLRYIPNASLEGKVKPDQLKYLSGAMAIKIKDNAQKIVNRTRQRRDQS